MSQKSQTFLPSYLKSRVEYERPAPKSPSYAPPAFQAPAPVAVKRGPGRPRKHPIADTQRPLESIPGVRTSGDTSQGAQNGVQVAFSLTETVALVSAALQAADVALQNAQKWESLSRGEQREQALARAVMLEMLAEKLAKAARNAP